MPLIGSSRGLESSTCKGRPTRAGGPEMLDYNYHVLTRNPSHQDEAGIAKHMQGHQRKPPPQSVFATVCFEFSKAIKGCTLPNYASDPSYEEH